ncbi:MAG: phage holin family protein [Kofleriaceae bacterium]
MAVSHEPKVGDLLKHIGDDMKTIAVSELELSRYKLTGYLDKIVAKASVMIMSAFVALVGFAMLCVTAVVALYPVIPQLWLRLLIMSFVFIAVGGGAATIFAKKLLGGPDIDNEVDEVGQTIDAISNGLSH